MFHLLVFLISISLVYYPRLLAVQEVILNCQRQITSTIICTLPSNTNSTAILEVISVSSHIKRKMTDMEVRGATEVSLSNEYMSDFMPFGIGQQFKQLEALCVIKSNMMSVKKRNFGYMQNFKSTESV
jgi:hypothetical protein